MNDQQLVDAVMKLGEMMASSATGKTAINDVNDEFRRRYALVAAALVRRNIPNPLRFGDLWDWWTECKSGSLPTYLSRRTAVGQMVNPLLTRLREGSSSPYEPTGWERVDRNVIKIREALGAAKDEEDFQAVGLLCREAVISLAQAVFVAAKHPILDGELASDTDANRMLAAYIASELRGGSHEEARRYVKNALSLALALQHQRTAAFREAAMCAEATASLANLIAIIDGRRDPQPSRPPG